MGVCVCRPKGSIRCHSSGAIPFESGSLIGLELNKYARLTQQQSPKACLSLFPRG